MISNVKKQKQKIGGPRGMKDRKGGETIAQQARKLLRGEESWGPGLRDFGVGMGKGLVRGGVGRRIVVDRGGGEIVWGVGGVDVPEVFFGGEWERERAGEGRG